MGGKVPQRTSPPVSKVSGLRGCASTISAASSTPTKPPPTTTTDLAATRVVDAAFHVACRASSVVSAIAGLTVAHG